ncbi:MAG: hypothetical protein AB7F99_11885 [Vicinamibacterales bacterium]
MNKLDEKGIALVFSLLALLMLSALGAGLVMTTSTEAVISGNFRAASEARHAARAIGYRALLDLQALGSWDGVLAGVELSPFADGLPAGPRQLPGSIRIDLTEIANVANCGQAARCSAVAMAANRPGRPWAANNPLWRPYAWGSLGALEGDARPNGDYLVVALVGDDGGENDGDPQADGTSVTNPGSGRILVRGLAFGPRGIRSSVELTLVRRSSGAVNVLSIKDL